MARVADYAIIAVAGTLRVLTAPLDYKNNGTNFQWQNVFNLSKLSGFAKRGGW